MVAEKYSESHLYTLASMLSRVVEAENPEGSTVAGISNGLRQLYDNGLCNRDITETLMVKAWRLVLLTEVVNDMEVKELQEYVGELAKDFVDSIEKLGIYHTLKERLDLN